MFILYCSWALQRAFYVSLSFILKVPPDASSRAVGTGAYKQAESQEVSDGLDLLESFSTKVRFGLEFQRRRPEEF